MKYKLLFLLLPLLMACGNAENEYSSQYCQLLIDNNTEHRDPTLARAMTPYSGVFVCITTTVHNGASFFRFTDNQGSEPTESRFSAIDDRRKPVIGMNNAVIVGYGNVKDPAPFFAYDRECPNCFEFNRIPVRSYPLQMLPSGLAECKTCKRKYNLNNRGLVAEGEGGKSLTRYRSFCSGPYGVLQVN